MRVMLLLIFSGLVQAILPSSARALTLSFDPPEADAWALEITRSCAPDDEIFQEIAQALTVRINSRGAQYEDKVGRCTLSIITVEARASLKKVKFPAKMCEDDQAWVVSRLASMVKNGHCYDKEEAAYFWEIGMLHSLAMEKIKESDNQQPWMKSCKNALQKIDLNRILDAGHQMKMSRARASLDSDSKNLLRSILSIASLIQFEGSDITNLICKNIKEGK